MEEIEYLEEYEDLILPAISDNASTANTAQTSKSNNSDTMNVNTRQMDDEDSSSIDQDIFESLFDDNSDDDTMLSKKVDSKISQRREDRASMDSLDMLVKDLGEQLSSNVVSTTKSTTENSTHKSSIIYNKTISKGVSSSLISKSQSKVVSSTKSKQTIDKPKSELANINKPKSIATVRPTIQNQQQKRLLLTKSGNIRTFSNSTTTTTTSATSSSSGRLPPPNRSKTSTIGSTMSAMPTTPTTSIISTVSRSTKLPNVYQTKGTITQKKNISRPQPTIIKPEKPSTNKDPAEDPLSLEDVGGGLTSDSDSSFVYSDISDDSFASLSDLNDTDEYTDGDKNKASLIAAKSNLVSSSVERVNKNQGLVTTTQSDKSSLMLEAKQSESVCSSSAVSSIAATTLSITKTSDGTKNKNDLKGKGKEGIGQSTFASNEKSKIASSVLEITKNLPEKVTIISDTILNRIDTEFIRTITTTDDKKDKIQTNSSKTTSSTEKETKTVDRKEIFENLNSTPDTTMSLSNSNEAEIMRMSPDLENVANVEEVVMNTISSSYDWDEGNSALEIQHKEIQKNNDEENVFLQKELCGKVKNTTKQKKKEIESESEEIINEHNENASADKSNEDIQDIITELNLENVKISIKEKLGHEQNEKILGEARNSKKSSNEKIIQNECANNIQSNEMSNKIESTEKNKEKNTVDANSSKDDTEIKTSVLKKINDVEDIKKADDNIPQSNIIKAALNHSEKKNVEKPREIITLEVNDNLENLAKNSTDKEEVSKSISETSANINSAVLASSQGTEKNVCIENTEEKKEESTISIANNIQDEEKREKSNKDKNIEIGKEDIGKVKKPSESNKDGMKNLQNKIENDNKTIEIKECQGTICIEQSTNVKEKNVDDIIENKEKYMKVHNQYNTQLPKERIEKSSEKTAFEITGKMNNENRNNTSKSETESKDENKKNVNELLKSTQKTCRVTKIVEENDHRKDVSENEGNVLQKKDGDDVSQQSKEDEKTSVMKKDCSMDELKPRVILKRRNQIIDNDISGKNADKKMSLRSVVDETKTIENIATTSKELIDNTTSTSFFVEDIKIITKDNDNLNFINNFSQANAPDDKSVKLPKDNAELSKNELLSDVNIEINTSVVKYTIVSVDKPDKETREKSHREVEAITRRSLRKRNAESPLLSNDNTKQANRTTTPSTNITLNVKHDTQTPTKINAQVNTYELVKEFLKVNTDFKRTSVRLRKSEDTNESETDETKKIKIDTSIKIDQNKERDKAHKPLSKDNVHVRSTKAKIVHTIDKGKVEEEPPYKIPRLESNAKEASTTENKAITATVVQDERNFIRKSVKKLASIKYGKTFNKPAQENSSVSESKTSIKSHMSTRASPNKTGGTVMTFNEWLKRQNIKSDSNTILLKSKIDSKVNLKDEKNSENMSVSETMEPDTSNESNKYIVNENNKSTVNENNKSTVNENQNTRPKSTRRIVVIPKSDTANKILHKNDQVKVSPQVTNKNDVHSNTDNENCEIFSEVGIVTRNKIQTAEKIPEPGHEPNNKKKVITVTKNAELSAPKKSIFKVPQEPATNRRSFTPKKSNNDERQVKNVTPTKIQKCRKLRVRINRAIVAAYFQKLQQTSKSKVITNSSHNSVTNQKSKVKTPITLVTPIHLTRASSKTPVPLHQSESKISAANQVKDVVPSTVSNTTNMLNKTQPEHIVPSLDHLMDDNTSLTDKTVPAVFHKSLSSISASEPTNTRSKSAKSEIRLRVPVAGRANVLTIPPQNRRPMPMSTRQTQQIINTTKSDKEQQSNDFETGTLGNNFGSQPYLTRSYRKPLTSQLNAIVQSERSMSNKSTLDAHKISSNATTKEVTVVPSKVVEANETPTPVVLLNNVSTTNSIHADLNLTSESTIVSAVKEEIDELTNISLPAESGNVIANVFGASAFSSHTSNGTMFGVTPTTLDANGTRLYSFLHPAKYSRSHGMVVLDYCCPNLDGPMSAIDPTRIHAQIQAPVRELPAYIVMTTKLITRADLEANNTAIPASIRQKVEKITATNSKTQTVTKTSVTTAPTTTIKQKTQSSLPQSVCGLQTLQKHLPSMSTTTAKPKTPVLRAFASSCGTINPINAGLPTLTPFSAFSQTQSANIAHSPLTEGQRNLLRVNLRRFDALLKKNYHRIAILSLPNRQLIIESIIRDNINNNGAESLQPKDVEHAVRVFETYSKHMDTIASPEIVVTSASDIPASDVISTGSGSVSIRRKMTTNPTTSGAPTSNSKMHAPIFDNERNIIGWQLKVATTSTTTATTSTSGNVQTRSIMSTRSESLFSTSASGSGTSGLLASKRLGATQQLSRLSGGPQDTSRIFYSKPSMQTSTPIAGNPTHTSSSPTTPINDSFISKPSIRGNRGITLKQVQKQANSPVSGSKHTALSISSTTPTAVTNTYTIAQNKLQIARPLGGKPSSIRVTRQRAAAVDISTVKSAGKKTITVNVGTDSKNATPPKIIVINRDNSGNNLPTPDECILPDNTDANGDQNVVNAVIKHEQMDDDFIGGH